MLLPTATEPGDFLRKAASIVDISFFRLVFQDGFRLLLSFLPLFFLFSLAVCSLSGAWEQDITAVVSDRSGGVSFIGLPQPSVVSATINSADEPLPSLTSPLLRPGSRHSQRTLPFTGTPLSYQEQSMFPPAMLPDEYFGFIPYTGCLLHMSSLFGRDGPAVHAVFIFIS